LPVAAQIVQLGLSTLCAIALLQLCAPAETARTGNRLGGIHRIEIAVAITLQAGAQVGAIIQRQVEAQEEAAVALLVQVLVYVEAERHAPAHRLVPVGAAIARDGLLLVAQVHVADAEAAEIVSAEAGLGAGAKLRWRASIQ